MAFHLKKLSADEYRITDDAGNVSDPLPNSVFGLLNAASGDLSTVPLHPATVRDTPALSKPTGTQA